MIAVLQSCARINIQKKTATGNPPNRRREGRMTAIKIIAVVTIVLIVMAFIIPAFFALLWVTSKLFGLV
jgi:hypothetical protein